jgi:rubrerythrin
MNTKKDFKDMLLAALHMEEKGYEFYKVQGAKAKNKITKDVFLFLADNELLHIENIKNFHDHMKAGKKFTSPGLTQASASRAKELDIFSKSIDELDSKISSDDTDIKACEFAMDFEKRGYNYYNEMLSNAENEQARDFLRFFAE